MSQAAATPAQYAAAFWAALGEASVAQEPRLPDAFARLLHEDGLVDRWAEVTRALEAAAVRRTGAVARPRDVGLVSAALGPAATVSVQPELIAGAWLRAGDRLVDSSIRGQLQQLQRFLQGGELIVERSSH